MDVERIRAVVSGRVQGVGFRYFVLQTARGLELTGYVCNTPEGNVEVLADGPPHSLDALVKKLNEGPPTSLVQSVRVERFHNPGGHGSFDVRG